MTGGRGAAGTCHHRCPSALSRGTCLRVWEELAGPGLPPGSVRGTCQLRPAAGAGGSRSQADPMVAPTWGCSWPRAGAPLAFRPRWGFCKRGVWSVLCQRPEHRPDSCPLGGSPVTQPDRVGPSPTPPHPPPRIWNMGGCCDVESSALGRSPRGPPHQVSPFLVVLRLPGIPPHRAPDPSLPASLRCCPAPAPGGSPAPGLPQQGAPWAGLGPARSGPGVRTSLRVSSAGRRGWKHKTFFLLPATPPRVPCPLIQSPGDGRRARPKPRAGRPAPRAPRRGTRVCVGGLLTSPLPVCTPGVGGRPSPFRRQLVLGLSTFRDPLPESTLKTPPSQVPRSLRGPPRIWPGVLAAFAPELEDPEVSAGPRVRPAQLGSHSCPLPSPGALAHPTAPHPAPAPAPQPLLWCGGCPRIGSFRSTCRKHSHAPAPPNPSRSPLQTPPCPLCSVRRAPGHRVTAHRPQRPPTPTPTQHRAPRRRQTSPSALPPRGVPGFSGFPSPPSPWTPWTAIGL